jgi:hypothetical protein
MKTVRDACELQPNALSIRLSDQIEQLDELIAFEGDGAAFFRKTHITQGMRDLIGEGVARLAGGPSGVGFASPKPCALRASRSLSAGSAVSIQ